jgi:hypothetical protein
MRRKKKENEDGRRNVPNKKEKRLRVMRRNVTLMTLISMISNPVKLINSFSWCGINFEPKE